MVNGSTESVCGPPVVTDGGVGWKLRLESTRETHYKTKDITGYERWKEIKDVERGMNRGTDRTGRGGFRR